MRIALIAPAITSKRWLPLAEAVAEQHKHAGQVFYVSNNELQRSKSQLTTVTNKPLLSSLRTKHSALELYKPGTIKKTLRSINPDVIHVFGEPAYNITRCALEYRTSKQIITCRSAQNIFQKWIYPFSKFESDALKQLSGIFAVNQAAIDILGNKGFNKKIVLGHNGYESDLFNSLDTLQYEKKDIDLLFIGKIIERKGWKNLFDALISLSNNGINPVCTFVGNGSQLGELQELCKKNLSTTCKIYPNLNRESIALLLKRAKFCVIPSRSSNGNDWALGKHLKAARVQWSEQFCMVAVEALACGTPIISSRNGALPEVVGPNGIYFNENSLQELEEAILSSLSMNRYQYDNISKSNAVRAARYTWMRAATQLQKLWENC